jgi:radical SAM superfamily enzyme YgiQ (UPF0313 family)
MKKVILNCLPPFSTQFPSPPLSILKSWLTRHQIIEVITKGLTHTLIKKIFQSGIVYAQIGYESTSQNLLSKIKKKNTFSSNLLYIKLATKHHIPLKHVNVLTNMPDETEEDIMEATDNLRFLRFFLHPMNFTHGITSVHVSAVSKYFTQVKAESAFWIPAMPAYNFLKEYIDPKYHWDIFSFKKPCDNVIDL